MSDAGKQILEESFRIIERELGPHELPPWKFAVVRRMIHASADFAYARALRCSPGFEQAFAAALAARSPIVTDTEMVMLGIRSGLARFPRVRMACHLHDRDTTALADQAQLTRSAAGIRRAAIAYPRPILAIGNAPTAINEALRLVEEEEWQPAAIVGIPVGFVGVVEAKKRLMRQERIPYLTCVGRKGGSAVTAAAVNALVEWCKAAPV